jgi:beta-glucanase (GH16 family)
LVGRSFLLNRCIVVAALLGVGCGEAPDNASDRVEAGTSDAPSDRAASRADARDGPQDARAETATTADEGAEQEAAADATAEPYEDARTASDAGAAADAARPGWRIVWRDEFEGPAGTSPDATKWRLKVGPNNANGELEYYTARTENAALDGLGNLVITAMRESYMGASYTSARLETGGKYEQAYGRFESRIKIPIAQGMWPAFWAIGNNAGQVGWPACGEIDIMESAPGRDPSTNLGSLHGPGYSGSSPLPGRYTLPAGATFGADFHVFAIEWELNVVRFYVDENLYATHTPADLRSGVRWVFDHPFTLIVNVAVGGGFPGNPSASTPFPQKMWVDYVRAYTR